MKQFNTPIRKPSRGRVAVLPLALAVALLAVTLPFVGYLFASSRPVSAGSREAGKTPSQQAAQQSSIAPVRMARVVQVVGDVDWRREPRGPWAAAVRNMPIREGAQLAVPATGRMEIQFDDGSRARFGGNAVATLQTLFSDPHGEYTEINLTDGPAHFRLMNPRSIYQINTPGVSLKAAGPARFRLDSGERTRIAVQEGRVDVEGPAGQTQLLAGQFLDIVDAGSAYHVASVPPADSFDNWSRELDRKFDVYRSSSRTRRALPSNVALMADNLDDYGTWNEHPEYGEVWRPRVTDPDWRPYEDGRWVWEEPFGYTWVADEPWGWAPSHYGTWMREPEGWGWVPGPSHQPWSPAVVAFSEHDDRIGWSPLAPSEVDYSSLLALASNFGGSSLGGSDAEKLLGLFAIAQAAGLFPDDRSRYVPVPWDSGYVNGEWYDDDLYAYDDPYYYDSDYLDSDYDDYYEDRYYRDHYYQPRVENRNRWLGDRRYIPVNARAGCVIYTDSRSFASKQRYRRLSNWEAGQFFARGHMVGAPEGGHPAVCGPRTARWTPLALTPRRAFRNEVRVSRKSLARPVYRAALRDDIARASRTPVRTHTGIYVAGVEADKRVDMKLNWRDRRRETNLETKRERLAAERATRARRAVRVEESAERADSLTLRERRLTRQRPDRERQIAVQRPAPNERLERRPAVIKDNLARRAAQDRRVGAIRAARANQVAKNVEAHRAIAARRNTAVREKSERPGERVKNRRPVAQVKSRRPAREVKRQTRTVRPSKTNRLGSKAEPKRASQLVARRKQQSVRASEPDRRQTIRPRAENRRERQEVKPRPAVERADRRLEQRPERRVERRVDRPPVIQEAPSTREKPAQRSERPSARRPEPQRERPQAHSRNVERTSRPERDPDRPNRSSGGQEKREKREKKER